MAKFYGEIEVVGREEFKATNDKGNRGQQFTCLFKNIPENIIPDLIVGTQIRFDFSVGDVFYKKGKSKRWTFIKNIGG